MHHQRSVRRPNETVDVLMRVPGSKTAEHHLALIRHPIAITVGEQPQFGALAHINAAATCRRHLRTTRCQFQAHRLLQSSSKQRALVRASIPIAVLQNDDLVIRHLPRFRLRIRGRLQAPQTAFLIPTDRNGIGDAIAFIGKQTHLETVQHPKRSQLRLPGMIGGRFRHRDAFFLRLLRCRFCTQQRTQSQHHRLSPSIHGSFLLSSSAVCASSFSLASINRQYDSVSAGNQRCFGSS